ncbi:MAG: hypothetical protein RIM33_07280 [Alphaproteobacteria bacterium]
MASGMHRDRYDELLAGLAAFENDHGGLLGLTTDAKRDCLCKQIIASLRRIEWVLQVKSGDISPDRCDPHSPIFDPLRAAAYYGQLGHYDQAVWMTFIQTHFGKNERFGWKLAANVYGSFGAGPVWTFEYYGAHRAEFERMLRRNALNLADKRTSGSFSNHRKFQGRKPDHIARTFSTFYDWQTEFGSLDRRIREIHRNSGQEPTSTFDALYRSIGAVYGFGSGRLGRFDLLCMLGKLELAPIVPGSVYLANATGPYQGAKLLFCGSQGPTLTRTQLQSRMHLLDDYLRIGKQAIEDSICNWQKSPRRFVNYRG